jgi:hypothetical protein
VSQKEVKYILLQRAEHIEVTGYHCYITETVLPMYCGNYDHQTLATPLVKIEKEITASPENCWKMWHKKKWTSPGGSRTFDIKVNRTTEIFYESTGNTEMGRHHVDCVGGDYWSHDHRQVFGGMVVPRYLKVLIEPIRLQLDQAGRVVVANTQQSLPCRDKEESCLVAGGTYVWRSPPRAQRCHLYRTRLTKGIVVRNEDGESTYMSQDNSLVRLVVGEPYSECSQLVYSTNYAKLYLSTAFDEPLFSRKLGLMEFSTATYFNQQDGFLFGELTQFIQDELRAVNRHECEKDEKRRGRAYAQMAAEHRAIQDGETTALGDGWFTTAAGEAWYRYKCRNITVLTRDTNRCYSALPVDLWHHDKELYCQARGLPANGTNTTLEFFLEPHTHRLITVGLPTACVGPFAPLYRAVGGHWLRLNPGASLAATPKLINDPILEGRQTGQPRRLDFDKGGIYLKEDVDAMEKMRQHGRLKEAVTATITETARENGWSGVDGRPLTMRDIVPPKWTVMEPILDFLEKWGRIASTLISICFLFRLLTWLIGLVLRILAGPLDPRMGPLMHILCCLFPSLGPYLARKIYGAAPSWKDKILGKMSFQKKKKKKNKEDNNEKEMDESDTWGPQNHQDEQDDDPTNGDRRIGPYGILQQQVHDQRLHQGRLNQAAEDALARRAEMEARDPTAPTT